MKSDQTNRVQSNQTAGGTELRLRRPVRTGIWKMLLRRILPVAVVFVIVGSVLLEVAKRFLPLGGALQSPAFVLLTTAAVLCPLIVFSARQVLALAVNLEMAHLELIVVLGNAIAKRDNATEEHNLRVAIMAAHLAVAVGLDRRLIPGLFTGALLHDVGKIGIADRILRKPGKLSPEERQEMERHVVYGREILADGTWPRGASRVVYCHHERFDGSGYPEGKRGDEIPPEARLFAIVDVFDALTSDRPYKKPMALEEVLRIMQHERGTHFDPVYLDAFEAIAEGLYAEVVSTAPEGLKEIALGLVEQYYRDWFEA